MGTLQAKKPSEACLETGTMYLMSSGKCALGFKQLTTQEVLAPDLLVGGEFPDFQTLGMWMATDPLNLLLPAGG